MKKNSIIITILLSLFLGLPAVAGAQITFERWYGGTDDDYGYSVAQTSDEGYIVAGCTESFGAGGEDVYLIKTDATGDTLWTKTFGGTDDDGGYSVAQTSDGGYIIVGYTRSFGAGCEDVYLIKTNASGNAQWTTTFGGTNYDMGYSVAQTSDGGYIIAGDTFSFGAGNDDVWLIKTDATGNAQWARTFGGTNSDYDYGRSVAQTTDGGYIITGYTSSLGAGSWDVYLIKTDATGNAQWATTFGGTNYDMGYSVAQTMDGGYIITGVTKSFGAGNDDVWLIKTDATGNAQWTTTFGGVNSDYGRSVAQTTDGGYVITGYTRFFGGNEDVYLIKTNASGDTLWTKTIGGVSNSNDYGYSVAQTSDGGYIITGYTHFCGAENVYLIKTDGQGLVGIGDNGGITPSLSLFQNYPNPFSNSTTFKFALKDPAHVKLTVYNIRGQRIATVIDEELKPDSYEIPWSPAGEDHKLTNGIYFYRLEAGDKSFVKKMVIMR
jgi:hypothetical protein